MLLTDLIFILLFSLIFASILGYGFNWRHPARRDSVGSSSIFLFIVFALSMWAAIAWVPAWGPLFMGSAFLTFLVVGVIVSFLILALAVPDTPQPPAAGGEDRVVVGTVFGLFFWLLVITLAVSIIGRMLAGA
jgi:hypothetical protein